ncbi:hypothetical protein V061_01692 [Staphylococcus aureus R0353]|uniref:hypothetical protein n=1 Tax=Staphylococcus aureus TaxID=1280 RepID=UPI0004460704|nr:hypothetical protein [Staphylococcus aureus]EZY62962.1 hypothetical protein V061_01692 [Staphylococcus aureus R0353]
MDNAFLTSVYTIAGGVALYSIKESVRFFTEARLNKKQANMNNLYPIYSEIYKAAKMFIGAYAMPLEQPDTLRCEALEVINRYFKQKEGIKGYKMFGDFRYLINLSHHLEKMRELKRGFNNVFSVNQFCFNSSFVEKTIRIIKAMNDDLNDLEKKIQHYLKEGTTDVENKLITQGYKDRLLVYEAYLDDFNQLFRKKFNI